jgi:hypothetical protein
MTTQKKEKPGFYIFKQVGEESHISGSAYIRKNGKSYTLYINGQKYFMHPAKENVEPVTEEEGA